MENNASAILAIFVAVIIMFGYPLVTMARKTDKSAQIILESSTDEYVDTIRKQGVIKLSDYEAFLNKISSTGNAFDIEFELQRLDENATKKATQGQHEVQNKNTYATYYTTQVMQMINSNAQGMLLLKEGDIITVKVKNNNTTLFQQLTKYVGNNSVAGKIVATSSGIITTSF